MNSGRWDDCNRGPREHDRIDRLVEHMRELTNIVERQNERIAELERARDAQSASATMGRQ